jgi:hypothetical protein
MKHVSVDLFANKYLFVFNNNQNRNTYLKLELKSLSHKLIC